MGTQNLTYTDTSIDITGNGAPISKGVAVSATTPLPTTSTGVSSSSNTSEVALGSGATYTGTGEQNHYPDVMVSCQTDNTGTLYFDFSVDGTNWTTFPVQGFQVASGIHEFHTAVKGPRYFRVRLVNDTGAQSYLRLYTYFGQFRQGNSPLNQTVGLDTDAIHVRPTSFQDEVRIGRRSGVTGWNKFGYREGLTSSGGEQTIWATTGNYTPATSAETFTITYNSTTDGDGTTGATQLAITYISDTGVETTLLHTLGSSGSDVTSVSGYGINRVAVSASGSANMNTNTITVTHTTSTNTMATIPALGSVTQQCIYHVGDNYDAVAKFLYIHAIKPLGGGNPKVAIKGYVFNRQFETQYEIFRSTINTAQSQDIMITDPIGFNLSPTDVLFFVADTDTNSTDIQMRFSLNSYQRA
ncbi:hypothetical protein OAF54_00925 [bacterium]|nr:hypothetical protein [bacterium]